MHSYSPTLKGPLKIPGYIDPDDITNITVFYGANIWSPNTVYRAGDICAPTVDNGYYYQCSINGVSGSTEPNWDQQETTSGTAAFNALPWDLYLLPDQYLTDSVWSSNNPDITLSDPGKSGMSTTVTVSTVPASLVEFEITNHVTKSTGESLSRSFLYKINQQ